MNEEYFDMIEKKRYQTLEFEIQRLIKLRNTEREMISKRISEFNDNQNKIRDLEQQTLQLNIRNVTENNYKDKISNPSHITAEKGKISLIYRNTFLKEVSTNNNNSEQPKKLIEHKTLIEIPKNIPSQTLHLKTNTAIELPQEERDSSIPGVMTNIPFTIALCDKFLNSKELQSLKDEIEAYKDPEVNVIKIKINRGVSQVTLDFAQIEKIAATLETYSNNYFFIKNFTSKLINQAKSVISNNIKLYSGYSYLFFNLYNQKLFKYFQYKVMTIEGSKHQIKGLYLVFFGIIKFMNFHDLLIYIFEDILKTIPVENTLYVIEAILIACKDIIKSKYGQEYGNLKERITGSYSKNVDSEAVKIRINVLLS